MMILTTPPANHLLAGTEIFDVITHFLLAVDALVFALTMAATIWLYQMPRASRCALFATGWALLIIGCGAPAATLKLGHVRQVLIQKLAKRQSASNAPDASSEQIRAQADATLNQTIKASLLIVPLICGGLGANLVVAGACAPRPTR